MFLGHSTHTVDTKYRVFVPKRFQEVLNAEQKGGPPDEDAKKGAYAYLTRGTEGCIFLYSELGFQAALEQMNLAAFKDASLRAVQRMFFANTEKLRLDGSGRVLLPEQLRSFGGVQKEVCMVGVADRAEIWSKEAWDAFNAEHASEFDELAAKLAATQDVGGAA